VSDYGMMGGRKMMAERDTEAPLAWFRQHEIRDNRATGGEIGVVPAPEPSPEELALAWEIKRAWEATPHGTGPRATAEEGRAYYALFDRPEIKRTAAYGPFAQGTMINLVAALSLREQYREALAGGDFDLALLSVQRHSRAEVYRHWQQGGLKPTLKDDWSDDLADEDEDD
jgi:hypothetical protein